MQKVKYVRQYASRTVCGTFCQVDQAIENYKFTERVLVFCADFVGDTSNWRLTREVCAETQAY